MNDVDLSEWAYCGEPESEWGKTMIREHWLTGVLIACSFAVVVVMIARAVHG